MTSSPDGDGLRYYGLYPAIVTNVVDPGDLGRIEVSMPWLGTQGSEAVRAWATLLSSYAGAGQGFCMLPDVHTQVVVGFEAGDLRRPYIVGAAWNGKECTPRAAKPGNHVRVLVSRAGSVVGFDDTPGTTRVVVAMASGHRLILDEQSDEVHLSHAQGTVSLILSGDTLVINAKGGTVELNAATFNINAPTVNFQDMFQCNTGIHHAAISSPLYTPGAGNVW